MWSEPQKTDKVGLQEKLEWITLLGWVTENLKGLNWIGGDIFCRLRRAVQWPVYPEFHYGEKTWLVAAHVQDH